MSVLIYTSNSANLPQIQSGLNATTLITINKNLETSLQTFKENSFEKIVIEPTNLSEISQASLHSLYSILKAGGSLQVLPPTDNTPNTGSFKDLFTIAGFKVEENTNNSQNLNLVKPSWAGKGVATLKKKNNATETNGTAAKVAVEDNTAATETKKANPFAAFSAQAENKQTINEDNLLDNEEGYNKLGKDESCSTKPKACANCSCGRAELEAAADAAGQTVDLSKNIETGKVASSCGNCYLGDAFRCGSCPYKGLPAFKPGDKVKLDLSKDAVGGVLKEDSDVVVSNGKVKLQI